MTALNDSPLNALSEHVHALNTTFDQLFKTIDEQIDAIIMQDVVRIESLTEKHAALHGSFRSREKAFVDELQRCIPADQRESVPLSLTGLKSLYPQYTMFSGGVAGCPGPEYQVAAASPGTTGTASGVCPTAELCYDACHVHPGNGKKVHTTATPDKKQRFHPALRLIRRPDHAGVI